jgi:O-methyltransferase
MIGLRRLDNLEATIVDVVRRGIPGDLVETGVWRGGAVIFMRGVLRALGDSSRRVWACDSFAGLPRPDVGRYPKDAGDPHHTFSRATGSSTSR